MLVSIIYDNFSKLATGVADIVIVAINIFDDVRFLWSPMIGVI